jgi:hypothetical protein
MLDTGARVCVLGLVAWLPAGPGVASAGQAARPAASMSVRVVAAGLSQPPTPADFVRYPLCIIYAADSDTRIRVRAARVSAVCARLARELARTGMRWSLKLRRLRHILSWICRFADPHARLELEVIDAAANSTRGQRVCAALAHAGWFDLSPP